MKKQMSATTTTAQTKSQQRIEQHNTEEGEVIQLHPYARELKSDKGGALIISNYRVFPKINVQIKFNMENKQNATTPEFFDEYHIEYG